MIRWLCFYLFLVSFFFVPSVSASEPISVDAGVKAYDAGDYSRAISVWTELAVQGNAQAQARLGLMYYMGRGTEQNLEEAAKWFTLASVQGVGLAEYFLGTMFLNGQVFDRDYEQARRWLTSAREHGHTDAYVSLGLMAQEGMGLDGGPDLDAAIEFYSKGVTFGSAAAEFALGRLYLLGDESIRDTQRAILLLTAAADKGLAASRKMLGLLYLQGGAVQKDIAKAIKYLEPVAMDGDMDAAFYMAMLYFSDAEKQDLSKAEHWFLVAHEAGHRMAGLYLGVIHYSAGRYEKAIEFFAPLAGGENSLPAAQHYMGVMNLNGQGTDENPDRAFAFFLKAANAGFVDSEYFVGVLYRFGMGTERDLIQSFGWVERSARNGYVPAMLMLGRMYVNAEGTDEDYVSALAWFCVAAKRGNKEAEKIRDNLLSHMEPDQVDKALALSKTFFVQNSFSKKT